MKNWKTTVAGIVAALALMFAEYHATHTLSAGTMTTALALAGMGTVAKDSDVTGGTREQ